MRTRRCIAHLIAATLLIACSDEGTTPNCPDLPLYDVLDASPDAIAARNAAAARDCVTAPGMGRVSDAGGD